MKISVLVHSVVEEVESGVCRNILTITSSLSLSQSLGRTDVASLILRMCQFLFSTILNDKQELLIPSVRPGKRNSRRINLKQVVPNDKGS